MGCSNSEIAPLTASKSIRLEKIMSTGDSKDLSLEQMELIQSSWKLIDDESEFGLLIMIRIFTHHAEIRHKWIFANDLFTEREIRSNSQVIYHAGKVVQVLSRIIKNLKLNTGLLNSDELLHLGKNHYTYGIQGSDFEIFEESLLYCLQEKISNEKLFDIKMKMAWNSFFRLLITKLCDGIRHAEVEENNSKNTNKKNP